jgi:hypothetical protein
LEFRKLRKNSENSGGIGDPIPLLTGKKQARIQEKFT